MSEYDERALQFAKEYSEQLLAIDVDIDTETMLNTGWKLFAKHFTPAEVGIKNELVEKYWGKN